MTAGSRAHTITRAFHWSWLRECTRNQTRDTSTTGGWSPPIHAAPTIPNSNDQPDQLHQRSDRPAPIAAPAWLGTAVAIGGLGLSASNVVQGVRKGDDERVVWGVVGLGLGTGGLALGLLGRKLGVADTTTGLGGPIKAYAAAGSAAAVAFEAGTSRSTC